MAFLKRTWLARIGTGLNKFIIGEKDAQNKQTLTNSPDSITQEGDTISAQNLNDLEDRIEAGFNEKQDILTFDDAPVNGSSNPVKSGGIYTALGTRVPNTRKINNKPLSSDITLTSSDVGAVPTSRTINGKVLSSDISLTASDVGAVSAQDTGWLELYNSATYGVVRYRKLNGMVTIIGDMKENATIGTLAEAYRPAYKISAPSMKKSGSSYYGGIATVDTNGVVAIDGDDLGGIFCITYPV